MAITSRKSKYIITVYMLLVITGFIVIYIRLLYLQVIKGSYYSQKAYKQQTEDRIINPERGTIYDATGTKKLAQSTSVNVIRVVPSDIKDKNKVADKLSEFLGKDRETIFNKVSKRIASVEIADEVETEVANNILKWINKDSIKGVYVDEMVKRIYPYNNLAAQVLGVTGKDSQGLSGIELYYDSVLAGVEGKIVGNYDVFGRETPFKEEKYISPQNGKDLVLTIDATIQQIAEKELKKAVLENVADSGTAIVMDPNTGEVLAMACYPDFDINNAFTPNLQKDIDNWSSYTVGQKNESLNKMWRNTCISDAYEPGSCFKILTAAAALEENIVELDTPGKFVCKGYVEVGGWKIKCWRYPRVHGAESLRQGIQNSCNPVFMQMSQMMGKDAFCDYLDAFNLGKKTGIDLPAEATGIIHNRDKITNVDMATTAFGQTISLTPIQLIASIASTINGGSYYKPHVVKAIKSQDGTYYEKVEPEVLKKVVSEEVSKDILSAMESTVNFGTASGVKISGYRVGGKTATAEQGRGANLWYSAGFVGVAPIEKPELIVSVYLNNPTGPQGHQGGLLCGPVVGNILSESLRYLEVEPDYTISEDNENEILIPDVEGKSVDEAKNILTQSGFNVSIQGDVGGIVADQIPKGGANLISGSTIQIFTDKSLVKQTSKVPDVRGKTMVEAIKLISNSGLNIKIVGKGKAITQDVYPGTELDKGSIITIKFAEGEEWQ